MVVCLIICLAAVTGAGATPIDLRIHWIEPAWVPAATGGTVEVSGLGFDSTVTASVDGVALPASSVQLLSPTRLRLTLPAAAGALPTISTLQLKRTLDPVNIQTATKTGSIFRPGSYTLPSGTLRPGVFYVRPAPNGNDANAGTSPATAKATLNAAIDTAFGINDSLPLLPAEIRAAAGTYSENVRMPRGAVLLGGWSTDFTQRDPDRFVSIIDGQRNNLSAVRTSGSTQNFCVLDGFTLTNSRRTGAGAAFRSYLGGPTLSHNVIIGNIASKRGAGIYFRFGETFDASATIAHNLIVGNKAQELSGGGVLLYAYYYTNQGDIDVAVTDNLIVGNRAILHGGGVAVGNSVYYTQDRMNVSLSHNRVQFNQAENGGALAVYPALSTQFSVRAHNNLMQQNAAIDRGGAVFFGGAGGGDLLVTSSTLVGNSAAAGGALYRAVPLRTGSQFTALTDDIIWSNTGGDVGDPETQVVIHYTLSNDDFSLRGAGNFTADPRFVAGPLGPFYLDPASPAINNGSDLATLRGLSETTNLASQGLDTGRLDIGVHYPVTSVTAASTPQFLHLVPSFGNFLGGDWVLVRGSDFKPGARITFGGSDAARTLFVATNRLLAEPPPRSLQGAFTLVDVQIVNPGSVPSPQILSYRYVDADSPEWDSTLGVISADSPEETTPAIIVRWNPALDAVSPPIKYNVHREANTGTAAQLIIPQASNLIASGLSGTSYVDRAFLNRDIDSSFVYRVRALDSAFLPNEEMNLTRVFGTVRVGTNTPRPDPSIYLLGPREATSGDVVTLEALVSNQGSATAASVGLDISLPPDMTYVTGTTRRDGTIVIPDDTSGTLFPLDLPGITISDLPHSTSTRISFQVRISGTGGLLSWVGVVSSKSGPEVRDDNNRYERFFNTKPLPGTDVSVVKTAPASALSGSNILYTVRVANNGTLTAQNVILTDTLPSSGLSYVNGSTRRDGAVVADNASGTPFPLDGSGLALGSFGGADFTVIEFTAAFTATSGSVVNTATATTTTTDTNPSNNTAQAVTSVITADLALSKTALAGVVSGRNLVYTLDVSVLSASAGGAKSATLADPLPTGAAYVPGSTTRDSAPVADDGAGTPYPLDGSGLSLGDIGVGQTVRVQFTVNVTLASGNLVNQASVSALSIDPNSANNTSQASIAVVPGGTPLGPVGSTLRWQAGGGALAWDAAPGAAVYFVHRSGIASAYASGSATLMTPLGITVTSYGDGTLPAAGQALYYRVNAGDGMVQTDELHMSDVWVEKSAPVSVVDGSTVTYTVRVRNVGVRQAEAVALVDTLPAQATYIAGTTRRDGASILDDGSGSPFPLDGVGLALAARPGGSLTTLTFDARLVGRNVTATNRATASTATPEHTGSNNTGQAATALVPPPQADLNLSKTDSPDPVMGSGGTLRYTLVLRNDGNLPADNVILTDTLPASGITFLTSAPAPSSQAGATLTFALGTFAASDGATGGPDEKTITIDVRVDMLSGTLSNTANATTTTFEEDLTDNSASASTTVQAPPADLVIDKTGPATAGKRAFIIYTLTVTNAGPSLANAVTVTDILPAGVTYTAGSTRLNGTTVVPDSGATPFPLDEGGLNIGNLASGATATITFQVRMPNTVTTVINQATVTSGAPDPNTANNSDSLSTSVQ